MSKRRRRREEQRRFGSRAPEIGGTEKVTARIRGLDELPILQARNAFEDGQWAVAVERAEVASGLEPSEKAMIVGESSFRLARRAVLVGQFGKAKEHAERAVRARPGFRPYQEQLAMVRRAAARILHQGADRYFSGYYGSTSGNWWEQDLLGAVRGWEGQSASIEAPMIMQEVRREALEDIYALGTYVPWHDGRPPKFTQYVRQLKAHGKTVEQAAILLWQGLTQDMDSTAPDWIEQIDVVVPMATSWRSFEEREIEVSERLASELASMLCVPMVDAFERDPDAMATHTQGDHARRLQALIGELRTKNLGVSDLMNARGVLIVDDIVTYGSTFEACARKLKDELPEVRCWGAALAYTETQARRKKAERERGL